MTGLSIKLKSKKGQYVVNNLDSATTIGNLKAKVSEITQIPEAVLHILVGFPPKPLDLSKNYEILSSTGITNGDTLIVEERQNVVDDDAKLAQRLADEEQKKRNPAPELNDDEKSDYIGILLKKAVPADNSCLFTSIGYVLNGQVNTDCGTFMRDIIIDHVSNDRETYNEGILGRPNREYCEWIQLPESWGGAIEVSILSNFYKVEIDVVDITNAIINRFGEDKNYDSRVFLLYDGIHYDPLFMESLTGGPSKTIFPIEEERIYQQAELLAKEAKSSRQFTDVDKFTLRCLVCDSMFVGHLEAQKHAKKTNHTRFGEV